MASFFVFVPVIIAVAAAAATELRELPSHQQISLSVVKTSQFQSMFKGNHHDVGDDVLKGAQNILEEALAPKKLLLRTRYSSSTNENYRPNNDGLELVMETISFTQVNVLIIFTTEDQDDDDSTDDFNKIGMICNAKSKAGRIAIVPFKSSVNETAKILANRIGHMLGIKCNLGTGCDCVNEESLQEFKAYYNVVKNDDANGSYCLYQECKKAPRAFLYACAFAGKLNQCTLDKNLLRCENSCRSPYCIHVEEVRDFKFNFGGGN